MREHIVVNAIECGKCHDVIESTHVHDFKACGCGAVMVDGGKDYLRRAGDFQNAIERSVTIEGDVAEILFEHNLVIERSDVVENSFKITHKDLAVCYVGSIVELEAFVNGFDIGGKVMKANIAKDLTDL